MNIAKKIGYIAIVFWGCKISLSVIHKIYRNFIAARNQIDLSTFGHWAMVTGCTHGIGKAFLEAFAKEGLNIILVGINYQQRNITQEESITVIAENLKNVYGVKTKIIYLNIVDGLKTYKDIEKQLVGLEIGVLVNNFGQHYPHPEYFLDLPGNDKIYMNLIQCNIIVTTNMCRVILPHMVLRRKGVIINISSSVAVIPSPLLTVYAATKAYILKFSKGLQMEYNKYGIIVQCLLPANVTNSSKGCVSSNWISPSSDAYVESAIKTIGIDEITTGFFPHTIILSIVQLIYKISPSFLIFIITSIMEINRNQAINKYIS